MVVIRRAEPGDLDACFELGRTPELTEAFGVPPLKFWLKALIGEGIFFVADENGNIVGFIAGERTAGDIAMMHLMSVAGDKRGKGIGTKLLGAFEVECRERKLKVIFLYGYSGNIDTINFFEKMGYTKGSLTYELEKFLR